MPGRGGESSLEKVFPILISGDIFYGGSSGIFEQWIINASSIISDLPRMFVNSMDSEGLCQSQNICEVVLEIFMLISTHFYSDATHIWKSLIDELCLQSSVDEK